MLYLVLTSVVAGMVGAMVGAVVRYTGSLYVRQTGGVLRGRHYNKFNVR